jgi:hypothetical protein
MAATEIARKSFNAEFLLQISLKDFVGVISLKPGTGRGGYGELHRRDYLLSRKRRDDYELPAVSN